MIWSDESKFNIFGSNGRQWCWRQVGEPLRDAHVMPTVKHGGGSIMVWGCISWEGVGNWKLIEGKMTKCVYREILQQELLDTISKHGLDESTVVFQQDNDPKHNSILLREWFSEQGFSVMRWPPQSPDLNPIEHVWNEVDRRLRRLKHPPTSKKDLWEKICRVWEGIEVDFVRKLINTMPDRCVDVVHAKGGFTLW